MKDSRSANKPTKSKLEQMVDEMESVMVDNRYGKGPATKESLVAKISDWRSTLKEMS